MLAFRGSRIRIIFVCLSSVKLSILLALVVGVRII